MLSFKEFFELSYWRWKKLINPSLDNQHYKYFFTEYFGLAEDFYRKKDILDIGCGPRGSLEWADMARSRIGVDPLVNQYLKMGAGKHKMQYLKAYAEELPFPDQSFDVVSSFNSLDHVENISLVTREMTRVLKKDGYILLIVDIHQMPTFTEPQSLKWELIEHYFDKLESVDIKRIKMRKRNRIYHNIRKMEVLPENHLGDGVLTAILKRTD